jgi:hypothetical protein
MADQQYDNEMRGVLFKQREKKSDRSPDYTGEVQIDGVKYRLSGWAKQGRSGTFLSLAVSKSDTQPTGASRQSSSDGFLDDGIGTPKPAERAPAQSGKMSPEEIMAMGKKPPQDQWDDDIPF